MSERPAQLFGRQGASWIGFLWGFAEGLFFFVVPDVYLTFAILLHSVQSGVRAAIFSVLGSLAAVVSIYALEASGAGDTYRSFLFSMPGVSQRMLADTLARVGTSGLPLSPDFVLLGVPLKVYATSAAASSIPLGLALLWTIYARAVRLAPGLLITAGIRHVAGSAVDRAPRGYAAALLIFWMVFYAFYFSKMGL